ncbi:MAG: M16 family metallopeptidase [Christensenellales bacterium]|jgi:predicted Zn-dependent peptidase
MYFDQVTLPNGLRIIGERMPNFRSVSAGLWIGVGSQYESHQLAGMSHYIEHMVFKGTTTRTAREIAEQMDEVGGQLNAFTSKECTCFYAKVVDEHTRLALDVLSDLVVRPVFDDESLAREKGVILEEIDMAEDTPEDLAHDLLMLAKFGDQPVARPILGSAQSVQSFTRADVAEYWTRMYRPENAVLAIAGGYDWDEIVAIANEYLGDWARGAFEKPEFRTDAVTPTFLRKEKDIEQANICLGYAGLPTGDARAYELSLFSIVFGGAMSSRLFQRIREESGMAYSVYSYPNSYADCGMLSVFAATNPENAKVVTEMIFEEAAKLAESGLTQAEFQKAREQLKAGFILGQESTSARMHAAGRRLLLLNRTRTEDEALARVNAIEFDAVNELMRRILGEKPACALVSRGADGMELL